MSAPKTKDEVLDWAIDSWKNKELHDCKKFMKKMGFLEEVEKIERGGLEHYKAYYESQLRRLPKTA